MVRVMIEPPKGNAESAVDNLVQNHEEWTDDAVEHSLTETTAGIDGTGTTYVRGDYRFVQNETATTLLDRLESRLQSLQGGLWYRIGYHVCDHDADLAQTVIETERWQASVGSPVPVSRDYLVRGSVTIRDDETEVTGYTVDEAYGEITATSDGDLADGATYSVEYEWWATGGPCYFDAPGGEVREDGTVPGDIPTL